MNNTALQNNNDVRGRDDRRRCPTPIVSRFTFYGGRRRTVRRDEDRKGHIYVDLYSTRLLVAVISLLLLSCLDAYLTLELIDKGTVVEANPIMAYVLNFGTTPFTVTKFTITAFSLTVLCVFKNVRITRVCLPCAIKMYLCVVGYEVYLFML